MGVRIVFCAAMGLISVGLGLGSRCGAAETSLCLARALPAVAPSPVAALTALIAADESGRREKSGYAVDIAQDGEDGLFKAQSWDYDAIVLDLMLPKLSGWDLLQALRRSKPTPVLILTARDAVTDRVRGLDSGADDLLTLARADAGQLLLRQQRFDLKHTVENCVNLLTPVASAYEVAVEVDLRPAALVGDPDRIAQVVLNLLTNAIHYNRQGGMVSIRLDSDPHSAEMTIADTGVGIAEEFCASVFERFFRTDEARSREAGGSGLGLAICREIVHAHGGDIALTSLLDRGTTVIVRLPRAETR